MADSTGLIEAERIADGISAKFDKYRYFRAVLKINGITYQSESILRPEAVSILVNQPAGLQEIQGLQEALDVWGTERWVTV